MESKVLAWDETGKIGFQTMESKALALDEAKKSATSKEIRFLGKIGFLTKPTDN
jgi:hypothetical protein